MIVCACNNRTKEAEIRGLQIPGQPGIHNKNSLKKQNKKLRM
jgi:hypothetical protein